MPLPEGRKSLTDEDMVILLHNMARSVGQYGAANLKESEVRQIADRFNELSKQSKNK